MNYLKWKSFVPLVMLFLTSCNTLSANQGEVCPDIQGSYKIEKNVDLFIQKQADGDYLAMVQLNNEKPEFLPMIISTKQQLKDEKYSECTVMIQKLGLLMPSDKNKKHSVSAGSQNYMSKKAIDTPLIILFMSGFQSDVFGVEKISNKLPPAVTIAYANREK
ncbi:hypothetical protein B7R74_17870 [Yersinia pseudotuberculosis]|uniref:hypothetical protein n=1 Tax=Yersinia pseudotuberculosis TaxID=633 RepID=UPI000D0B826B|nr:hypothetical protein [Yersinia pseudotuberculosis]PSH15267.1 hypothetical protein B7R74_17870 [Yersinia pseudotuberculosis]